MTDIDISICQTQGRIYAWIADNGYDVKSFSDAYLTSKFCKNSMDTPYSRFQLEMELECLDFIMPEIQDKVYKLKNNMYFSKDIAEWIGFMYRYLYIYSGIKSCELKSDIPFDLMCKYYPEMHTIDEESASEIMIENMKKDLAEKYERI